MSYNLLENLDPNDPRYVKELLSGAWGLIANAGEGDWTKESPEWQEAAKVYRENWHRYIDRVYASFSKPENPEYITVEDRKF